MKSVTSNSNVTSYWIDNLTCLIPDVTHGITPRYKRLQLRKLLSLYSARDGSLKVYFSNYFFTGIALKKVEAKEAQENGKGQGLSDVATILARRVAVEFSDSDDCPSDSEYDSDDWGKLLTY